MDEHIDSLIAQRLSGECSPAEDAELNAWIAASPDNAAYFGEMEAAWRTMDDVIAGPVFDTAAAWEQVAPRLQKAQDAHTGNGNAPRKSIHLAGWIKYATAAAAILIIAVLFIQPDPREIRVLASSDSQEVRLPDNSVIRLRKGSSISYPEQFSATERLIHLEGEAFFDVSKREDQRFVVDAGSIAVTVLGTSFNVKSGARHAEVSVATGRVQLVAKDYAGKKILLRAGRSALFESGNFTEADARASDTAWLSRELIFTDKSLRDVIGALAADADTPVQIDPAMPASLLDAPVQIRFRVADPLQKRLADLGMLTGTEAVRQGNGYLIRMRRS